MQVGLPGSSGMTSSARRFDAGYEGTPKNLIFGSYEKPDIRFSDAIDNDIEIVGNAENVLVNDRPIGTGGVRWRDLQSWWQEVNSIDDASEGKSSSYRRLRS
ncbi:MAG TPA: hypothetical protein VF821_30485 [Lentzea sp.]